MGTRYADEKIGEITDDEVIFKEGERFFLKEISIAVHKTVWTYKVVGIFTLLGVCKFINEFVDMPAGHYIMKFFFLVGIAIFCGYIVYFLRPHNLIVIKAKNGETMYNYPINTDGEYFVGQLNRYVG